MDADVQETQRPKLRFVTPVTQRDVQQVRDKVFVLLQRAQLFDQFSG